MPNLDSLLSFPTPGAGSSSGPTRTPIPPRSSHILVTDTTDAPALFVLMHFLRASHAHNKTLRLGTDAANSKGKAKARTKLIWLGCTSEGVVHLKNVARKSGVHLDEETAQGTFKFIDAAAEVYDAPGIESSAAALSLQGDTSRAHKAFKRIYDQVARELSSASDGDNQLSQSGWASRNIIVVDDLTALAWGADSIDTRGYPANVGQQASQWLGALTALATKNDASVVTLMHADATSCSKHGASDPVDECLLSSLLQTADVWVEVKELASGRARDCDGEITVHPLVRPSLAQTLASSASHAEQHREVPPLQAFAVETPCPTRAKAVLYRIAPDGQSAALGGATTGSNTGRVQVWPRGTGRGFL
ncbi:hypothetical protein PANT_9c00099 [Moesziomyces antarcticus T-34]|uniref:Uncharacterized protein n=1 Tax=Pseudozyma antarctica (strain T-34) TaxID=1151754 RepID=M9LNI5_PSEA3|nr:hypothetical protein PANT_9c00099 [Moesziomyces antarcticus T-34]